MTCSSCKYLEESKKVDGKVSGACYYCSYFKKYVNGSDDKCEKHDKSYARNNYACDKIYNEGLQFYDDDKPVFIYILQLMFYIILGLLINTFI